METFLTIIHVIVAIFMILVVLVQGGNSGGMGAAFGGGNSSGVFGAGGATSFLGKLTYGAAIVFVFTTIMLAREKGGASGGDEYSDKIKQRAAEKAEQTESPAAEPKK